MIHVLINELQINVNLFILCKHIWSNFWAQASAKDNRAWVVITTRALCELGSSHIPLKRLADYADFLRRKARGKFEIQFRT